MNVQLMYTAAQWQTNWNCEARSVKKDKANNKASKMFMIYREPYALFSAPLLPL